MPFARTLTLAPPLVVVVLGLLVQLLLQLHLLKKLSAMERGGAPLLPPLNVEFARDSAHVGKQQHRFLAVFGIFRWQEPGAWEMDDFESCYIELFDFVILFVCNMSSCF